MSKFVSWDSEDHGDDLNRCGWHAIDAFGSPLDAAVGYERGLMAAHGEILTVLAIPVDLDGDLVDVRFVGVHPSRLRPLDEEKIDADEITMDNATDIDWEDLWGSRNFPARHTPCVLRSGRTRFVRRR